MIDTEKKEKKEIEKERTRRRMQGKLDPNNYEYIPSQKKTDYYDNDINQRVAIYVRVSTDDVRQTTSFELQKKYYEDFVTKHPNWTLIKIYADEGISGTSTLHRDAFNQMIMDCKASKIDLIITKSVSRFARNVLICIGMIRELAQLKPPVGVFFESECIFSLKDDSQMALTFLSTMAEEESHTRSRSMETSLRMRLDNGIPLTPKLYGYTHDFDGNLIINPVEAPTVKLIFYMYLYGYSSDQIAKSLTALERKSYYGNINWTSGTVLEILKNERHCGDVKTRKTYTPDYHDHKSKINNGQRPQSIYRNHHDSIISRDDYIAVQNLIENAKYKNKSFLPELRIINTGILKGFVTMHPRWAAFKADDYYNASLSIKDEKVVNNEIISSDTSPSQISLAKGNFDLREFEITRTEFFENYRQASISFANQKITLSSEIVHKLAERNYIEFLINPIEKKFALRTTKKENRQGVYCSKLSQKTYHPRDIPATAFFKTIFELFSWDADNKYRIIGNIYKDEKEVAYIFDASDSEAYLKSYLIPSKNEDSTLRPLTPSGKRVRAIPTSWSNSFGRQFYAHELSFAEQRKQSKKDWNVQIQGKLYESGKKLNVTEFSILDTYIKQELNDLPALEQDNE